MNNFTQAIKTFFCRPRIKWTARMLYYFIIIVILFIIYGFQDTISGSFIYNEF